MIFLNFADLFLGLTRAHTTSKVLGTNIFSHENFSWTQGASTVCLDSRVKNPICILSREGVVQEHGLETILFLFFHFT